MLVQNVSFPAHRTQEFENIQWRAWEVAKELNEKAQVYGFNVNSSAPTNIYPAHDLSPSIAWDSGDLTWENFNDKFPEYIPFLDKYNFYHGITMISRPVYCAHKHGNGEHTITYPLRNCNKIKVFMVTPDNLAHIEKNNIDWLKNNESYSINETYECVTGKPFIIPANHFHKTSEHPGFVDGDTIITVWHELSTFSQEDVDRLILKLEDKDNA